MRSRCHSIRVVNCGGYIGPGTAIHVLWRRAKKYLADLHESIGHQTTLYCGCPYERTTRSGGDVDREEKSDTQTNKCDEASIIHRNRPRWWTGGDR